MGENNNVVHNCKRLHYRINCQLGLAALALCVFFAAATPLSAQDGAGSSNCTVSALLVNSCGPWLGASPNNYSQAPVVAPDTGTGGLKTEVLYDETRIGRQLSIVHDYLAYDATQDPALIPDQIYFINRPNTYLLLNWKPALSWVNAGGGQSTTGSPHGDHGSPSPNVIEINRRIDAMAESVHSVAPHKIFLNIFHEPEDNVTGSSTSCQTAGGNSGSPADYVNMWRNVRARFDSHINADGTIGIKNVVWVFIVQGNLALDQCLMDQLYPGDAYVDWIGFDPYVKQTTGTFQRRIGSFYEFLTNTSTPQHDYLSKPWMLAEYGIVGNLPQQQAYDFYDAPSGSQKSIVDDGVFPNLKAYIIFDSGNSQTEYYGLNPNHILDPEEQVHYNNFANDPKVQ